MFYQVFTTILICFTYVPLRLSYITILPITISRLVPNYFVVLIAILLTNSIKVNIMSRSTTINPIMTSTYSANQVHALDAQLLNSMNVRVNEFDEVVSHTVNELRTQLITAFENEHVTEFNWAMPDGFKVTTPLCTK